MTSELVEEQATGEKKQAVLKESECEEDSVMSGIAESSCLHPHHGRSRIGTETSVENPTCIENPGKIQIQVCLSSYSLAIGIETMMEMRPLLTN